MQEKEWGLFPCLYLQRKLTVGVPDDPLEQEADAVADSIMRMPRQQFIQRKCAHCEEEEQVQRKPIEKFIQCKNNNGDRLPKEIPIPEQFVQRKCSHCEEREDLQRKLQPSFLQCKSTEAVTTVSNNLHDQIVQSRGKGDKMDAGTQSFMENRFGTDFGSINIHTDNNAVQMSSDLNARAFTIGSDIYFNQGEYQPQADDGKHLLAHELTHTIQQGAGILPKLIQRQLKDPLDIQAGYTEKTVYAIIIDRESGRTRFFTKGGYSHDGVLKGVARTFKSGEYLLKKSESADPYRTWDIFYPNNAKVRGGMQFDVVLKDVKFDTLTYTDTVQLTIGEKMLQKFIDLDARIAKIASIASRSRVGKTEEQEIIELLADIPFEQSKDFYDKIAAYQVKGENLLELLDSVVDTDENMALHEALSRIHLKGNKDKGAKSLAEAPVLAWHDVMGFFEQSATFSMEKMPNGKIRIKYLGGIAGGLYSNPDFKEIGDMDRRTRLNWMAGGVEFDPDQAIIIHDYDRDKFVVVTAGHLMGYQHSGTRKFIEDIITISSLATPIGAETIAGKVFVITMEKVLPLMVLLVEENKLNIRKWFPTWGPSIIQATEVVKMGLAIYGAAQFVKGGWTAFAKLRQIRNSRKLMDAAIVADNAGEIAQAEKIAARLEAQADELIGPAEKLKQELAQADMAAGKPPSAEPSLPGEIPQGGSAKTAPATAASEVANAQTGQIFEGITQDTKTMFATEEGKKLKQLLEANPEIALLVKLCNSPCFPNLNQEQVARLKEMLKWSRIHGIPMNEKVLKEALHGKSPEEIDHVLDIVNKGMHEHTFGPTGSSLPAGPSTMRSAEELRNAMGIAWSQGKLAPVKGKWIQEGKIGRFPGQIADKMKGKTFASFREFRETFWKLVAADADLSPLGKNGESLMWSETNLTKMRNGHAPVVSPLPGSGRKGKLTLELDHRLAIKNEGGVYDMSNIDIVHKEFHELVGEK